MQREKECVETRKKFMCMLQGEEALAGPEEDKLSLCQEETYV